MKYAIILLALLAIAGCDSTIDSAYNEQIVVGAFIYANEPIDSIVLHRTTPFGSYYNDIDYAVTGATVMVTSDGVTDTLLPAKLKGRYYLPASKLIVQPGKTYQLSIVAPNLQTGGTHQISATTTIPMPIHFDPLVDSIRGRTFMLDTTNLSQFAMLVTTGPVAGPDQRYLLSATANDTSAGRIRFRQRDTAIQPELTRFSNVYTGPSIPLTARFFSYYGSNTVTFYAIDTNWTDYQRQIEALGAGNPYGTGDYQPTLNHIVGGIGIFGSAARDTVTIFLKPKS